MFLDDGSLFLHGVDMAGSYSVQNFLIRDIHNHNLPKIQKILFLYF